MRQRKITNKMLMEELIPCLERGCMSNKLYGYFQYLIQKLSTYPQWLDYPDKDELMDAAQFQIIRKWHKFDPNKSNNAWAYFTSISQNAFLRVVREETRQKKIMQEMKYIQDGDSIVDQVKDTDFYDPAQANPRPRNAC